MSKTSLTFDPWIIFFSAGTGQHAYTVLHILHDEIFCVLCSFLSQHISLNAVDINLASLNSVEKTGKAVCVNSKPHVDKHW